MIHAGSWRTSAHLADGREVFYYDEIADAGRERAVDLRDPSALAKPGLGELRFDDFHGEWVAYVPHRSKRPLGLRTRQCPLCPSTPDASTEIPASDYAVVAFEDQFPMLHGPAGSGWEAIVTGERPAAGRSEVVCFSSQHDVPLAGLGGRRIATVFAALAERTACLLAAGYRHVLCTETSGEQAGITLEHPHGHIYALPFVAPRTQTLMEKAHQHRAENGSNLFDELVAGEVVDGRRIVQRSGHWVAFVPAVSRWAYEIWMFPLARVPDLPSLPHPTVESLGDFYAELMQRLHAVLGPELPFMTCWQQAPAPEHSHHDFALHLQIMPMWSAPGRFKFRASNETAGGVWSNEVLPEVAASRLRDIG